MKTLVANWAGQIDPLIEIDAHIGFPASLQRTVTAERKALATTPKAG
jgi:hypothetical protein